MEKSLSTVPPATSHRRPGCIRACLARSFTLIELVVVPVIIGVLAALIVANVLERADDARITAARTSTSPGDSVQRTSHELRRDRARLTFAPSHKGQHHENAQAR